jgi:signal transduction histidine kinase/ligand-binding sensor domain-containing protein
LENQQQKYKGLSCKYCFVLFLNGLKKFILLVISLIIGNLSFSQPIIPRFENLGVNNGLPHSSVYSILQDKKGFMWFGTADGLCRYDGNNLVTFHYKSKPGEDAVKNFVRGKMLEDKTGNIWYCNESGLYKWDVLKEVVLRVKTFDLKKFRNSEFQCVYIDKASHIWIFNITYGILQFNPIDGSLKQYPLPLKAGHNGFALNFFDSDPYGNIWFRSGNDKDPYIVFNKKSQNYFVQSDEDPPHAFFFERNLKILAYDDKLIYRYTEYYRSDTIFKLVNGKKTSFYVINGLRDNYGRLWMTARGKGLFYYDEKNKHFHEFHHDNSKSKSLPFDLTTCLFIDRNDNLWIGTDGGGVARLDLKQPKFSIFPLAESDYPLLNDYFTKCFFEDEKGRIWFGSQSNGLSIYDPDTYVLINFRHEPGNNKSIPGNIVGSILKDRDGNIWVGSSGGISLFNEKKKSFETIPIENLPKLFPLVYHFVNKLKQLDNGDILAATSLGIIKIKKGKNGSYKGYYYLNNPWFNSLATDIEEMPDKTLYATLRTLGLFEFEQSGDEIKYVKKFLQDFDLMSVRKDEIMPGILWIGSNKGLIRFNTVTHAYRLWNEKNGLANNHVYGSLEDSDGNLWLSTNKGLSFFDRKLNRFENYSFHDGLQSNEFNSQAFHKSETGTFYFGGVKGFNWFNPAYSGREQIKPTAAITGIEINEFPFQKDSVILVNRTLSVPYDRNDFNFEFAALDYTRPEANKFRYMLQGWDAGWISTGVGSARYANLPPGNYTLRLQVSNTNGIWSNEEMLHIRIQTPFWQRRWFIAIIVLLSLASIIFATDRLAYMKTQRKLRLLEKKIAVDAERNRISADMHDEIGSGITHIALLSELIQTQQKEGKELRKDIATIATSARSLVQSMSGIIWALNPQNDTLENLLAYTREQSQKYFEPFDVRFDICFPEFVPDIRLSNEQRRNLYLVIREALNNAMKHSGATAIALKLEFDETALCFSVSDNGTGIGVKQGKPDSNGLRNMRNRMENIGGTIGWLQPEKGTTVRFCLNL